MSAHQKKYPFDFKTQYGLGFNQQDDEIVVDFFCGGGGAGTGLEMGLGRAVTVAKNHSPAAISMHTINHPHAKHFTTDVFEGDPDTECGGRAVGWFHMSPDCTHHSQAAGGQPRKREIRNLSWIGLKWAGMKRPRVISLENVKQILQWGPLVAKRCKSTGRVIKLGGGIAELGEVVPVNEQFLVPDPKRRGQTWAVFVAELQRLGYAVEWRVIKACDFGAPTSRERLFMIARCDGQPIVWPEPTHAKNPAKGQQKWRTAAECIDWTIPSKSIFGRKKDLAPATLRRVAKGMRKFVLDSANPFIVPIANWSGESVQSAAEPLRTVTSYPKGGAFSVVSPVMVAAAHGEGKPGGVQRWGAGSRSTGEPLATVTASGGHSIAAAHLVKFRFADEGKALGEPLPTITSGGNYKRPAGAAHAMGISTVFMAQMNGGFNTTAAKSMDDPAPTITAGGGGKSSLVELQLSPEVEAGALRVAAFLISYYGTENVSEASEPSPTITTRDRLALVTVTIKGTPYVIVDICLRMLQPAELYRAQGFPGDYIISHGADGKPFTKTQQVHMCGNSVSPPPMAALARANDPWQVWNFKIKAA
ncbi:DNA cytosine methyltransferase [Pseudomonas sp. TWR3-1-1]|uniref:DNA cytosine methyltransferase n=1 Tax=Pseudomonas sp. TWR3-1-1 TaxID=2804633 RepID=UPI003CE72E17